MAYPISNIRAIGTEVAAVLKTEGIRTTIGLLRAAKTPKQRLRIAAKIGADPKQVLDWATAADRMRVKGIGWEYAELLRAAGVKTVNDLQLRNPQKLVEKMREAKSASWSACCPRKRPSSAGSRTPRSCSRSS